YILLCPYPTLPNFLSYPTRRSSDLHRRSDVLARPRARATAPVAERAVQTPRQARTFAVFGLAALASLRGLAVRPGDLHMGAQRRDRKSTRLNSSHVKISYAVFCLKK